MQCTTEQVVQKLKKEVYIRYSPKPFMAFLRTSASFNGSAPGKSGMVPLNPRYTQKQ